ncbi:site-specific integrase [Campylobacter sp. LR291e]|uniref:tyrosine-type recombinase/integrase n=1 Tax=Campylobacter sp. LR291e TaxID=2593546 RepID=UPI0012394417|nr:site-specific integrase [Campylobacter sp. LR291e]KAA6231211.1 site-specific integrase [Campylobacter sp. LR291e]
MQIFKNEKFQSNKNISPCDETSPRFSLFKKGKLIYVDTTLNGSRVRFSTKKIFNDDNLAYVKKNILSYINHFKNKNIKNRNEPKFSVINVLDRFLQSKQYLKLNTKISYKSFCNLMLDFCSKEKISDFRKIDKEKIINFHNFALNKTNNKKTFQAYLKRLKNLLNFACDEEILLNNPYVRVKMSGVDLVDNEAKPFSLDEVKILLNNCEENELKIYLQIAFFTGARTGEILGLRVSDLDFVNKKIKIQRTLILANNTFTTPKTQHSLRVIDMIGPVKKILQEFTKDKNKDSLIFTQKYDYYRLKFKELLQKLNLEQRHLYNTRHSFASIMLQQGEEHLWIAKMLGHKNLNITYEIYAKFIINFNKPRATFLKDLNDEKTFFLNQKTIGQN